MIYPVLINLFLNIILIFKNELEYKLLIFIINILLLIVILKKYYKMLFTYQSQKKKLKHMNLDIGLRNLNEKYIKEKMINLEKRKKLRSIVI